MFFAKKTNPSTNPNDKNTIPYVLDGRGVDVVVMGEDIESIITAVSAARFGGSTLLIRPDHGPLGGLSTRGGLSYMDITPELTTSLFRKFLHKAEVQRVALAPHKGHHALEEMLFEARVPVLVDPKPEFIKDATGRATHIKLSTGGKPIPFHFLIDTTPDALYVRALGASYTKGLGGMFGQEMNFLGISPVFTLTGVDPFALADFEIHLRQSDKTREYLDQALPYHPQSLREELVTRNPICPKDEDYLDILNPYIGIAFHQWWTGGDISGYGQAPFWIDGGNISRFYNASGELCLGFNGLVSRESNFDKLLSYSQGKDPIPKTLLEAMQTFENYLKEEGSFSQARVHPPERLYVRQTLNVHCHRTVSGTELLEGGVLDNQSVGVFSYWLDFRGINMWEHFPTDCPLPKPYFNVGIDCARPLGDHLDNILLVSRSGGYSPIAQGACRIIQHLSLLGESIGLIAAWCALNQQEIDEVPLHEIRQILSERNGTPIPIGGREVWPEEKRHISPLLMAERQNAWKESWV